MAILGLLAGSARAQEPAAAAEVGTVSGTWSGRSRKTVFLIITIYGRAQLQFVVPGDDNTYIFNRTIDDFEGATGNLSYQNEVGRLVLRGASGASGQFEFKPSASFATEFRAALGTMPKPSEFFQLFLSEVPIGLARTAVSSLDQMSIDQIIRLRNHGVGADYIRKVSAAGVRDSEHVIRLRNHGVPADFPQDIAGAGYHYSSEELITLRSHGVGVDYAANWKRAGYSLNADELVRLRNHGVRADLGLAIAGSDSGFSPDDLIKLHQHGVGPDFLEAWRKSGNKADTDAIVDLRNHGVSAEYFSLEKSDGAKFAPRELIDFRNHGLSPSYVRDWIKAGFNFGSSDLIRLHGHGVPVEFAREVAVPGREPLSAETIIDLRQRGISPDLARRIRQ